MAVVVIPLTIEGTGGVIRRPYLVMHDSPDVFTAISKSTAETMAYDQFVLDEGTTPNSVNPKQLAQHIWEVVCEEGGQSLNEIDWEQPPAEGAAQVDFKFRFQAKPKTITSARFIQKFGQGPGFGNSVNVQNDGHGFYVTRGMTVNPPPITHELVFTTPNATITSAYQIGVARACGTTNSQPWQGRGTGELMLVSASGAKRSKSDWQISFGFAWGEQVSETMSLGGSSVNVTRRYHDILWTLESTKSEVIGGSAFIFPQPKAAYVHRPHGETNFLTALGF